MATGRHIVGFGGAGDTPEQNERLFRYVFELTREDRPRLLIVPTATAESDAGIALSLERFARHTDPTVLRTFPYPPDNLRSRILDQDAIWVGGGNTANMLAIWRVHGIDRLLREAWDAGVVLSGVSAGMICWFEAGVTDSFGPRLEGLRDGLGLVAGSACPHYDGEELRRPRYRDLVDKGFPPGLAADDGVGLRFEGTELVAVVTCRPGAAAYRVDADGEERLPTREL